jgi:hypothetical protein
MDENTTETEFSQNLYARLSRGMWEMIAPLYPNLKDFPRRIAWNEDPTRRFDQIIRDVNREHARKIGFIPFGYRNNYPRFIDYLSNADTGPLEEINLYHLNKNDFGDLYREAEKLTSISKM